MKNNILNVELISNNKFSKSDLDSLKDKMEVREDFIILYSLFIEVMELNFNGCMEIYLEDVAFESDLQETLPKMIHDLDELIPGGLSNDSKVEWITPQHISNVWYKDNNNWLEKMSDTTEMDFFSDEWDDDYDGTYGFGDFGDSRDDNDW